MAVEVARIDYLDHEGVLALVIGPFTPAGSVPVPLSDTAGRLPRGDVFFAADDVFVDEHTDEERSRPGAQPVLIEVDADALPEELPIWAGLPLPPVTYRPARLKGVSVAELLRWAYEHEVRAPAPTPA